MRLPPPHSHPAKPYFPLKTNHLHPRPPNHSLTPCYNEVVRANLSQNRLALSACRRPAVFAPEKRSRPTRHCSLKSESTQAGELRLHTRAVAPRPRPQNVDFIGRTQEMMKTLDLHAGFFLHSTNPELTGTNRRPAKSHRIQPHLPALTPPPFPATMEFRSGE